MLGNLLVAAAAAGAASAAPADLFGRAADCGCNNIHGILVDLNAKIEKICVDLSTHALFGSPWNDCAYLP
jgi:hypothetical protein